MHTDWDCIKNDALLLVLVIQENNCIHFFIIFLLSRCNNKWPKGGRSWVEEGILSTPSECSVQEAATEDWQTVVGDAGKHRETFMPSFQCYLLFEPSKACMFIY